MSVHQPVTIGHYTHCANCLEPWPCHQFEADHASRRHLATAIGSLTVVLALLLLLATVTG